VTHNGTPETHPRHFFCSNFSISNGQKEFKIYLASSRVFVCIFLIQFKAKMYYDSNSSRGSPIDDYDDYDYDYDDDALE
jgi:hypothetical protein